MEHIMSFATGTAGYVIPFLVVLGVVVVVHELGHFLVARRCGVKVETFSIGFGPEIFHWFDRHGTRWRVAWVPLGGYVKMFGDADPASFGPSEKAASFSEEEKRIAFYSQPLYKRFSIVAAGPASNYVFAAIVLAFLYMCVGQPFTSTVVNKVVPDSAAARAGILEGDKILSAGGQPMNSFEDIKRFVTLSDGSPVRIEVERTGSVLALEATPVLSRMTDRFGGEHVTGVLGIGSTSVVVRRLGPAQALGEAFEQVWKMTTDTLKGVGQIIAGTRGGEELGGPLRIAEMSGKVAQDGMAALVWFVAVISVNLGLINLFPIPLLDGGHLAFYLIEGIRGRPLGERVQEYGFRFGAAVVLFLMLFATWNDLVHLRVVSYLRGLIS